MDPLHFVDGGDPLFVFVDGVGGPEQGVCATRWGPPVFLQEGRVIPPPPSPQVERLWLILGRSSSSPLQRGGGRRAGEGPYEVA
jgi:hypothetical protein